VFARLQLAAEAAADVVADDPHPRQRQAEDLRDPRLDGVDTLGGLPEHQRIAVPARDATVRLERGVDLACGAEGLLDHGVGLGEAFRDVASRVGDGVRDVAALLDLGRAGVERLLELDHRRQDLVVDHDGPQRVVRQRRRLRRHRRDGFPLEAARGVEEGLVQLAGPGPEDVACQGIVGGEHNAHPGHRGGLRGVHLLHAGPRVRRAQDRPVEHVGENDVGGVNRRAADALVGVDARVARADGVGLAPGRGIGARRRRLGERHAFGVVVLVRHGCHPFFRSAAALFAAAKMLT
jgi:hypothetical protein